MCYWLPPYLSLSYWLAHLALCYWLCQHISVLQTLPINLCFTDSGGLYCIISPCFVYNQPIYLCKSYSAHISLCTVYASWLWPYLTLCKWPCPYSVYLWVDDSVHIYNINTTFLPWRNLQYLSKDVLDSSIRLCCTNRMCTVDSINSAIFFL
jgi:hypothetical protein